MTLSDWLKNGRKRLVLMVVVSTESFGPNVTSIPEIWAWQYVTPCTLENCDFFATKRDFTLNDPISLQYRF